MNVFFISLVPRLMSLAVHKSLGTRLVFHIIICFI